MPNPSSYPAHYMWSRHFFDVWDFGAFADGNDDTPGIQQAIDAAASAGGGTVFLQEGTYLCSRLTLKSAVHVLGSGIGATIIKLKNGANTDLFSAQTSSINLSASFGTGPVGSLYNFSIQEMTLDGNKANQSSGTSYPLRFYGYGFILHNLRIKNGYSGGVLIDWNGGGASPGNDGSEAQISNVKVHDCNSINFQMGGPHDSQINNLVSYTSGTHCLHIAPNAQGTQFNNVHLWGPATGNSSLALLCECSSISFANSLAEGSDTLQVAALASGFKWVGGRIFASGNFSCTGLKLGQAAGETPYSGQILQSAGTTTAVTPQQCRIETDFYRNEGSHGSIWFDNDGGQNDVMAQCYQTAGSYFTGTPANTTLQIIHGVGLTPDGTQAKGGEFTLPINAFTAFALNDDASNAIFSVNTRSKRLDVPNNTVVRLYSDAFSTTKMNLNNTGNGEIQLGNAGSLYSGNGAPSAGLGSNGDYYFRTDTPSTANQRIYVKSAGAWVGIV